jgi:SpoVK/Ycf46/Vps4 family AAA+-type ATPase
MQIVFITTNNREVLDPAMVRHGRVDVEVEICHATKDQVYEAYVHIFGDKKTALNISHEFLEELNIPMCTVVETFIKNLETPLETYDWSKIKSEKIKDKNSKFFSLMKSSKK